MPLTAETLQHLRARLLPVLGDDAILTGPDALREYFDDYTEIPGVWPDLAVRITDASQIPPCLRAAFELGVPVIPAMARSNVGGLCLAERGGMIVDLRGLNRILEVNEADRYMVIEPGVTWQQVKDHLDAHHPKLRFGYALSPPDTCVLGNCLMDGLTNLSLRWGSMSDWLNALEVVLPDGAIVRTGSWAWNCPPVSTCPTPRLDGLVLNFHGSTGIVIKAAVEVKVNFEHRRRCFYFGRDIGESFRFINTVARSDLCDDLAGLTWPLGKFLFGATNPTWKDDQEPTVVVFVDYSSDDQEVFTAKGRAVERLAKRHRVGGEPLEGPINLDEIITLEPSFRKFADWPMRLDFLVDHPGGGLTWVGTYGPTSQWPKAVQACHDLMLQRGFPPSVVTRAMRGGHYGVLRMIAIFDKRNAAEVTRVAALNREIAELAYSYGYIPYKTPRWAVELLRERMDPGFLDLMTRVKDMLDPQGLHNPGRWIF